MSGRRVDFFVSHAGRDTGWAEWLAWQLQEAGYSVELDVWDWAPGEDFVARMSAALERADRLLAVCTEAYFSSAFGGAELRAAFAQQSAGRVVPVLVEPVTLPALYTSLVHVDLTGLDEVAAAARLRARLTGGRPPAAPPFPRAGPAPADKPGFAGALPAVWKVPPRNPRFTGRDGMLIELRRRLRAGEGTLVVQALYGLGGVGKTQLALEYAHRFAADYDLVWWIDAEQPVLIPEQLVALAARLNLAPGPTVTQTVERLLAELRGRFRWLLVFDNAERPGDVADYRPAGPGHVLITSRSPGWGALGGRLEVDVLARAETIALLRGRIPALSEKLADKLPPSAATCRWPPRRPPATSSRPTCLRRTICAGSAPNGRPCWPAATWSATTAGSTPPGRCRWSGCATRTRPRCSCWSWPRFSRPNPSH